MVSASVIWSFTDQTANPTSIDPGITAERITSSEMNATLYSAGGYSTSPVYQLSSNTTNATPGRATSYISLKVAGVLVKPLTLTLKAARGGSSTPRGFRVRTSLDDFGSDLGSGLNNIGSQRPNWTNYSFAIPDLPRVNNFEVRIYVYAPSLGASIEVDDITITVDVPKAAVGVASIAPTGELKTSVPLRIAAFAREMASFGALALRSGKALAGSAAVSGALSVARSLAGLSAAGAVGLSGALGRSVGKIRRGTVALVSTVRTAPLKRYGGALAPTGSLMRSADVEQRRAAKSAGLMLESWGANLLPETFKAAIIETSAWRLKLESEFMIAGSVEELRVLVNYVYNDVHPMPDDVFVKIGDSAYGAGTVTRLSSSQVMVSLVTGPLPRGIYPVRVSFTAGGQSPVLFAGNLNVLD